MGNRFSMGPINDEIISIAFPEGRYIVSIMYVSAVLIYVLYFLLYKSSFFRTSIEGLKLFKRMPIEIRKEVDKLVREGRKTDAVEKVKSGAGYDVNLANKVVDWYDSMIVHQKKEISHGLFN